LKEIIDNAADAAEPIAIHPQLKQGLSSEISVKIWFETDKLIVETTDMAYLERYC